MAMIKLSVFGGMVPKMGDRVMPDSAAMIATNVRLQSGELRPINSPGLSYVPASPKTLPPLTIFSARTTPSLSSWFTWPFDVDCVRVPLATEVESRFCWTGDGAPKVAKYTTAITGAGNNYPALFLDLGIPVPQTKPTVAPSGGVGADVTRYYCYTFFSADGEESGPSPVSTSATGKFDATATWALSAMDTAPTNSGAGTATATKFTNTASAKHWLRVGDEVAFGSAPTVFRAITVINSASAFTVAGASIIAETTWARRANWNTSGMTRRIYRTSGTLANFLLVIDNLAVATTTYNDLVVDANILGDELITTGWEPPPTNLVGLCVHSSGAIAGFVDNTICFSEPLQPHAWITANRLSAEFSGVGIAAYGSSVVLATSGDPFVASGTEPASMTGESIRGGFPCLSKRSVIGAGDGVMYSSSDGPCIVNLSGATLFAGDLFTSYEWETYTPSTMIFALAAGTLYMRVTDEDGHKSVLIIDHGALTSNSTETDELYTDEATGKLYVGGSDGISLWNSSTAAPMAGQWKSHEYVFPKPVNLGAVKIDFNNAIPQAALDALAVLRAAVIAANAVLLATGSVLGGVNDDAINVQAINGSGIQNIPEVSITNAVTFNLYGGPEYRLIASRVVINAKVVRLPAGYKYDNFFVEVLSQSSIEEIRVAETPDGLRQA